MRILVPFPTPLRPLLKCLSIQSPIFTAPFKRSVSVSILLVACGWAHILRSSSVIPQPLSITRILSMPPDVISTAIWLAPESIALSISSRTIAFGRSITFLGVAQCLKGNKKEGIQNLQKAKEMGNLQADNLIEKYK